MRRNGFLAVDSASQIESYQEVLVGQALKDVFGGNAHFPKDLRIQSKCSAHQADSHFRNANGSSVKTTAKARVFEQLSKSLDDLGVKRVDVYFSHAPRISDGISNADCDDWIAIKEAQDIGYVKQIGLSNFNRNQVELLVNATGVLPDVLQNFSLTATRWDLDCRSYCLMNGIEYQGYGLNRARIAGRVPLLLRNIAAKYSRSVGSIVFEFAVRSGIRPVVGSSKPAQLMEALIPCPNELSQVDLDAIERFCK